MDYEYSCYFLNDSDGGRIMNSMAQVEDETWFIIDSKDEVQKSIKKSVMSKWVWNSIQKGKVEAIEGYEMK